MLRAKGDLISNGSSLLWILLSQHKTPKPKLFAFEELSL